VELSLFARSKSALTANPRKKDIVLTNDVYGEASTDLEAIADRIKTLPAEQIEKLEEKQNILSMALAAFNSRVAALPKTEQKAALTLLYSRIIDTVFDFHLSLETSAARQNIAEAETGDQKREALHEFHNVTERLAAIYRFE